MIVEPNAHNTCSKIVPSPPDRVHLLMDSPIEASKQQTERLTGFQAPGFGEEPPSASNGTRWKSNAGLVPPCRLRSVLSSHLTHTYPLLVK